MKIRNGFVSNSSSSSFIIACKPEQTKVKIEVELDFKDHGEVIDNLEDFLEYIEDYYGWQDKASNAKFIEAATKTFSEGKVVYVGSFSNESDDSLSQYLCEAGLPTDSKEYDVIDNEAGY